MGSRIRDEINQIFNCFCEVISPKQGEVAKVIDKYPETFEDLETFNSVSKFTYPCEFEHSSIQHYSFVLTSEDSKWTFGFCRYDPKTDSALVFLSSLPWHDTFYKLLNNVSEIRYSSNALEKRKHFLEALYVCDIPSNGTLIIPWDENTFVGCCPLPCELPSIPENRNLTEYYSAADAHNMAAIFASLLHERRVVFVSRRLPRLSACVQAAAALLYPMHWQHVFIPLLPRALADYVCAPMPFLIGAPHAVFQIVNQSDIADVVIFDADANTLQSPYDDLQTLPSEVANSLRRELRSHSMLGEGLARAFLRALVMLIGGYRDALRLHPGQRITFHAEAFLQSRPPNIQPFLGKILQLQIFQQFIEERLHLLNGGLGFSDEFEKEICQNSGKNSSRFRQQYKEWTYTFRKEGSAFFKTVRSKVREHGKDVRAAYKDIKSRMKDKAEARNGTSQIHPPRQSQGNLKASASYRRPLQLSKTTGSFDASNSSTSSSKSSGRQTLATLMPCDKVPSLAPASVSEPTVTVTHLSVPQHTTSGPCQNERGSDSERLLAEYGLDFTALSLSSGNEDSLAPALGSRPPTPPSSSPPPLTPPISPPPIRPAR